MVQRIAQIKAMRCEPVNGMSQRQVNMIGVITWIVLPGVQILDVLNGQEVSYEMSASIFGLIADLAVGIFIAAMSFIQYEKPTEWRDGGVIIHKTQVFI